MKMLGTVLEYSDKDALGYIEGYDEIVYLFHRIYVKDKVKLEKGDIVKFDFIFNGDKNMPYAIDIEKKEM